MSEGDSKPRKKVAGAGSWVPAGSNTLMPILMAEFWKRLAVNSDDPITWLKAADYTSRRLNSTDRASTYFQKSASFGITDDDLKVLLYGFANSKSNGGLALGANNSDDFVDAFGGKSKLDRATSGNWRFFGKTGSGGGTVRTGRTRNEAVFGGSVCIPAGSTSEPNGRLVAFFINIQAAGSPSGPRQAVLSNLASAMLPKVAGGTNRWGSDPKASSGAVAVEGTATLTENTSILKSAPVDSTTLTNSAGKKDKKCSVPKGTVLAYSDRESAAGNHMRLKLKFADISCPEMPLEAYVFEPHWNFVDKP